MRVITIGKFLIGIAVLAICSASAIAGPITAGNLVVVQVGDGSAALSSAATAGFLKEFTVAGTPVQSIPLPTTAVVGGNQQLVYSGTATSEGFLTLSANGKYLTTAGYATATGTASITGSTTIGRVAGRVDVSTGTVDSSTVLAATVDGSIGNPRSVVSNDGSQFWVGSSAGGVRYTTFGSTGGSTQIESTPANTRVVNINNGQLYMSSASSPIFGVATVGSGLPTTTGQTVTLLPGFPTATGPSNYDYVFADSNTLYVADDSATGGLQKWVLSGGTWALKYTLNAGLAAGTGIRGLAGENIAGVETLYATTSSGTNANNLVTIADVVANSILPASTFVTLATAPTNAVFRGVELVPIVVPEPASLTLLSLAGVMMVSRRRTR
jgi:hypothetical protein